MVVSRESDVHMYERIRERKRNPWRVQFLPNYVLAAYCMVWRSQGYYKAPAIHARLSPLDVLNYLLGLSIKTLHSLPITCHKGDR